MKKIFYTLAMILIAKFSLAQSCPPASAYEFLDINNVKARINNGGDMWWDLNNDAQYVVPKSGNVSSLFAGALWIGGIDAEGQLHMAAQTYRQTGNDFFPGPLDATGNVTDQACSDFDRIWKVNKSTVDSFKAGLFSVVPNSILQWPGKGNPNVSFLPNQDIAPFTDANADGSYNPANGDYPAIPGDQALWFVFNDKGNMHTETGGLPLGIEVQCTAYAFKGDGNCLFSTTFYHYKIINKSTSMFDSTFVGLWTDPDLGCYFNDYYGCDTANNLGIAYNNSSNDNGAGCINNYGNDPPVLAIDFLKGPVDQNGITRRMDHFMSYQNDFSQFGNPVDASDYYNFLQSVYPDDTHLVNPAGAETNFIYPGDPANALGWSMCAESAEPLDFRMIMSSGPFILNAGETQTLDFAVVWDNTSVYPCPSFSTIADVANCAKDYFNSNVTFTGVASIPANDDFAEVFPNPALQNDIITFHLKHADKVRVFNVEGEMISNLSTRNQSTVEIVNSFSKGMYFYQVVFNDQSVKTGKFIVQ